MGCEDALAGQVILVTGAGKNLGRSIALEAASQGAAVGFNVRADADAAGRLVESVSSTGGRAAALVGDVADGDAVQRVVHRCRAELGDISTVIHCAGYRSHANIVDLPLEDWRRAIAVTLHGAYFLARETVPAMAAAGFGRFVFIGGNCLHTGMPVGSAHVAAAKGGLRGFVRALAQETGRAGITANVVSPGVVDTESRASEAPVIAGWDPAGASTIGRMAETEEIASLCLFLCGPGGATVNGQTIMADGGTFAFGD